MLEGNPASALTTELEADGAPYHMVLRGDRAEIGRGGAPVPDLRIRGAGADIARLFLDGYPKSGEPIGLEIEGSARQLRTLVNAFSRGD